jgi:signal transduction histidine kinase
LARQRAIDLDFALPEEPLWVHGDVTLIEQAVSNVVHNAVRYNREGGHVVAILERQNGQCEGFCLRVLDDGPGVSDTLLSRLAERHFRTDEARSRHPGGLGLGLHIAGTVAEAHGFTLDFKRSEFGGLEVDFHGPTIPPPAECAVPE